MDLQSCDPPLLRPKSLLLAALALILAAGCQQSKPQVAPPEAPALPVSHPVERDVIDYVEFTGRADAVHSVNIIPRVTGYLVKMPFKEGSEVRAGDLLFEIDPRPYQAQFDQARSQVSLNQAQLDLAKKTLARYVDLDRTTPGAVSKQALDQYQAAVVEATARVAAQQKSLEVYRLNKEFTEVVSPINGQVSRYYLTLGNLVNQDQTLLTTVVSLDPIYAYFDVDDHTLQQIRTAINEGRIQSSDTGEDIPIAMQLQGEPGYPHAGIINFVNNQVNPTTGSISMRGVFANPKPAEIPFQAAMTFGCLSSPLGQGPLLVLPDLLPARIPVKGTRLLTPGMFVRVRMPISDRHPALLVIDRAILSNQGERYVYVLDKNNKAQERKVTVGALQEDGLRVVYGLTRDDRVIVGGLQQVRAKMDIKPEEIPMPALGIQPEAEPKPAEQLQPPRP
jgi:multidrug efflux system membrane fusion protein